MRWNEPGVVFLLHFLLLRIIIVKLRDVLLLDVDVAAVLARVDARTMVDIHPAHCRLQIVMFCAHSVGTCLVTQGERRAQHELIDLVRLLRPLQVHLTSLSEVDFHIVDAREDRIVLKGLTCIELGSNFLGRAFNKDRSVHDFLIVVL